MKSELQKRTVLLGALLTATILIGVNVTTQKAYSKASVENNFSKEEISKNLTSAPLTFTANQGQWDDKIQFRANAGGVTMWFSPDGAYYQFTRTIESDDSKQISIADKRYGLSPDDMLDKQHDSIEYMMIKVNFVGSNANPIMRGLDVMEYKCNYFLGNDKSKWATDVPNYSAVLYEQIYFGIDLKYYGNRKQMEYDFIVSPGADFSQINIQYKGAESIAINDNGELVVTTKWGEIVEQRPIIYQIENNSVVTVDGRYMIQSDNSFGFEISGYNPALLLVIDPVLSYSTYLGGSGSEAGESIAVDASGAVYVIGSTSSADFPTFNPDQGTMQGSSDIFVTKLSSSGNSLIYSTYLGGSDFESGWGITVDASGAAYITGEVDSEDFPILNPYQGTLQGLNNAFVTKLSSSGSLVYSTYLGGTNYDYALAIAVDASGAVYVTGNTLSTDFPMLNPYQATHQGGFEDIFVTKLSSSGNSLIYSTYLGGSDFDDTYSIAVDASGAAYVAGWTESTDFPTLNPYQGTFKGITDVFVTKLSSSGSLVYSTYLGGSGNDFCEGIAVDIFGAAYITGRTVSTDFPMFNPYQGTYQGGAADVFVTKLSSSGNSLIYSTYLGGNEWDEGYGIAVDTSGAAYITGVTSSSDFPTQNPYQTDQPFGDVFVTKMNNTGDGLVYSTYLGGSDRDQGHGIAVDASGAAYVTGWTWSTDFPTLNPYQGTHQPGLIDVFVTKFSSSLCCIIPGDANNDGAVNIADVTFLISRIFAAGPAPPCSDMADANGNNSVNIADVTFLIARIFAAGPAPICGTTGS